MPTLISRATANDKTGTTSATYSPTPTIHHLLLARVLTNSASTTLSGWTNISSVQIGNSGFFIYLFGKNSLGNESAISPSGGTIENMAICEYVGSAYPYILDGTPSTSLNTSGVTSQVTGTITTTNPSSLIVTAVGFASIGAESAYSLTTGTVITGMSVTGSVVGSFSGQYIPGTTKTSFSDTAHWTGGAQVGTIIAAFRPVNSNLQMFM